MSFVPVTTAATSGAAAAAAAALRRKMEKEEQEMTSYKNEDLEGWEFKIVRSAAGKFKLPEVVRQLCDEEARAGWEMLEKFDDHRIRFKRLIENRADDVHLDFDPYRSYYGISAAKHEWLVAGIIMGVLAAMVAIGFLVYFVVR